jgi:alkaline phosphatase D
MDENVQALYAAVPVITQWDDHEVSNNYSASKVFDDRYTEKSVAVLAARAHQAFHEFMPIAAWPQEPQRVYRKVAYGPLLDVFVIDMRTYRGPNGTNLETEEGGVAAFLGTEQLAWLKRELVSSRATWKVIAADMPLSLLVPDVADQKTWEAVANADPGAPLGRELEFADLLRTIKAAKIRNTVWLTADVHYTAAHYYDPDKAVFQDFDPFWEFVAGPIHAGSFGPNDLDPTFGPEAKFVKAPSPDQAQGIGPAAGLQFFGHVGIAADTRVMTVTLRDTADRALWSVDLEPAMA